jgi:predicted HTH domain antitoxin
MITVEELVQAGLFPDEQTAVQEALRVLWQERPQLRIEWAIHQYQTEAISLAKAAAIAGLSFDRLKTLLVERGIQPRLGAETISEAKEEINVIEGTLTAESPTKLSTLSATP